MSCTPLARLRARLEELNVDAVLVTDITNVQWLTEFTGSSAVAIVTASSAIFVTDSRYSIQAAKEVQDFEVRSFANPQTQAGAVAEIVTELGLKALAFDPSMSVAALEHWKEKLGSVELNSQAEIFPPLRMIKTESEIERISAACQLADAAFAHIRKHIQVGVAELDLAIEIEFFFRRHGATVAFGVISVSGPNSALPHGQPSERKLVPGDFLTLDFGAKLNMYNSDITRTVVIGEASPRHREVYGLVLESQIAAIEMLKPGANGKEVDQAVRKILDKADLSQYFGHGLGHGLGRAVHDYGGISSARDQEIKPGQVWTVEPGVYIEGFGGVRIEDDVVVTDGAPRILTTSPKELLEIG